MLPYHVFLVQGGHVEGGNQPGSRSSGGSGNRGERRGGRGRDGTSSGRVNSKDRASGSGTVKDKQEAAVIMDASQFPPLPRHDDTTPIPTPGYKGSFIKLKLEDIINIVQQVKDVSLPPTLLPVSLYIPCGHLAVALRLKYYISLHSYFSRTTRW